MKCTIPSIWGKITSYRGKVLILPDPFTEWRLQRDSPEHLNQEWEGQLISVSTVLSKMLTHSRY